MYLRGSRSLRFWLLALFVLVPWLAETGHQHSGLRDSPEHCQACQFWSTHQADGAPAALEPSALPSLGGPAFRVLFVACSLAPQHAHVPRGPPLAS